MIKKLQALQQRYEIVKKLGKGSFGEVFQAICLDTNEQVAIKICKMFDNQNFQESKVLSRLQNEEGIPRLKECFVIGQYQYIVMQLLGESMYQVFKRLGSFQLCTILELAIQMLERIARLHFNRYIHRDLKLQQFLLDNEGKKFYLIDFGLAKKISSQYVHQQQMRVHVGNPAFASLNSHSFVNQSQKDDLESFMYMLIYLVNGRLPWRGIKASTKAEKWRKIYSIKSKISHNQLCEGCPQQFLQILNYIKSLENYAQPDYTYIFNLIKQVALATKVIPHLEWIPKREQFNRRGNKRKAIFMKQVRVNWDEYTEQPDQKLSEYFRVQLQERLNQFTNMAIKQQDLQSLPNSSISLKELGYVGAGLAAIMVFYVGNKLRKTVNQLQLNHQIAIRLGKRRNNHIQAEISLISKLKKIPREKRLRILNSTSTKILKGLEQRDFTSEEVLLSYYQQLYEIGKDYNAVCDIQIEESLRIARHYDKLREKGQILGPLHGLPVSLKDMIPAKGFTLSKGCAQLSYNFGTEDCLIVKSLRESGAIFYIKTTMSTLGVNFETYNRITGHCKNAYDKNRSSGGSSGGEGTALALKFSSLGIGSDIGGSIRIPCGWQGLYGIKPSSSRITDIGPYEKAVKLVIKSSWGPMGREVEDLVTVMRVLCQRNHYKIDRTIPFLPWREEAYIESTKPKFGICLSLDIWPMPLQIQEEILLLKAKLEQQGYECVDMTVPMLQEAFEAIIGVFFVNQSGKKYLGSELPVPAFSEFLKSFFCPGFLTSFYGNWLSRNISHYLQNIPKILKVSTVKQLDQLWKRSELFKFQFAEYWESKGIDAMILPIQGPAVPHSYADKTVYQILYTILFNFLDYTVGSMPIGKFKQSEKPYTDQNPYIQQVTQEVLANSEGMPISIQVACRQYEEEKCLRIMKLLEGVIGYEEDKLS